MQKLIANNEKIKGDWLVYLLLLTSVDTVAFGTNSNRVMLFIPRIVGALFIILFPIVTKKLTKINLRLGVVALILCGLIAISSYVNNAEVVSALSRIIMVLVAFSLANCMELRDFAKLFCRFMYFISCVAIITEILAYTLPSIFSIFPVVVNTASLSFPFFGIGAVDLNYSLIRSMSIFWEAGACAIYVIIAIMFQLFVCNEPEKRKLIVYTITLLITFSTTGYIAIFALLLVYVLFSNNKYAMKYKVPIISALTIAIIAVFMAENSFLYDMVFAKITDRYSTSVVRYASIVNGFEIALENPILGVSSENLRAEMVRHAMATTKFQFGANPMNTNTVTALCASYGLLFGGIFLTGTFKFFRKFTKSTISAIALFVVLMLCYCGEYFYSFLPFIFTFYGFTYRGWSYYEDFSD
ncbi:MAG: hypothetical protein EUB_02389 [Eubacterium sp.]|uniref:O-antigen ligase family protein n=1 Tax=Eubacterium sp. TaxID=142586 RepID=UPI00303181FF